MEGNGELKQIFADAEKVALREANLAFGTDYKTWEDFGHTLILNDFENVTVWEARKTELIVQYFREAGNDEATCEELLEMLNTKVSEAQSRSRHTQKLFSSHLGLVHAVLASDGQFSGAQMDACVEILSQAYKASPQLVSEWMEPVASRWLLFSEEEKSNFIWESIHYIRESGQEVFMDNCLYQYETLANLGGLAESEESLLVAIRGEWGIPEAMVEEEVVTNPKRSQGIGCAVFAVLGVSGFWNLVV